MQTRYRVWVFLVVSLPFLACKKAPADDPEVLGYLSNQRAAVAFDNLSSVKNVFTDSVIKANVLFFSSETHAVETNARVKRFLLEVIHSQTDTLCFLPELSYAACQMLNTYLRTGDEALLAFLYDNYRGTYEYTKENAVFWQLLRGYVQNLPAKKYLTIVGCDVEHQSITALRYLQILMGNGDVPSDIASTVNELKTRTGISYRSVNDRNWLAQRKLEFDQKRTIFANYLGEKLFDFEFTLNNMQQAATYVSLGTASAREFAIWQNFQKLYPRQPQGKWYGQWGSYHTVQRASHTSFAKYAKSETTSPVAQKVVTIQTLYENSFYMNQTTFAPTAFTNFTEGAALSNLGLGAATLFNLNANESPFRKKLVWWGTDETFDAGVTTDYIQMLLLVKNATAMQPYR